MLSSKMNVLMGCLLMLAVATVASAVPTQEPMGMSSFSPDDGFEATAERTGDGTCVCSVKSPSVIFCTDYETQRTSQKLQDIQYQISNLTHGVNELYEVNNRHSQLIAGFETNLREITSTFDLIEGGQVLVTRGEIEGVRTSIQRMESSLYALKEWHGLESEATRVGRIQVIMHEASDISQIVDEMGAQENSDDLSEMQREIFSLTNQLKTCNYSAQASSGAAPGAATGVSNPVTAVPRQPLPVAVADGDGVDEETLPERWPAKKKQNPEELSTQYDGRINKEEGNDDSCGRLLRISEPYTVRANLGSGAWMRDPLVNTDLVYYHVFTSDARNKQFQSSLSVRSFQRDETYATEGEVLGYVLEAVLYNGSAFTYTKTAGGQNYYNSGEYRSRLSKIDWSTADSFPTFVPGAPITQRILTRSDESLTHSAYSAPSSVPTMDLTVDESGVWVLYGDAQSMLVVSKIDQDTLAFEQTWKGAFPKNRLANCFVICGRVYCLNSYSSFDTRVIYYMDTETGFEGFTNIPFFIKYGSLTSIEYNPRDQMLYGFDNGHAVVYSLTFEE